MTDFEIGDKCPKCGSGSISTQYETSPDRLKKVCGRCGYYWHEDCEDCLDNQIAKEK